ncbi:sigma-70 family RNA polymerase sigma factor [Postechiella marina]|uniref:Sigma-70 family RNA polymerase sigma factor n=1 Tax=Postechiella marina TaxID=943941 RepID=A0ABP8C6C2_9FLAO
MSVIKIATEKKDEKVWLEFVNGDKDAFGVIYNSNVDALYAYGMKLNADSNFIKDCIQDVFLDIYSNRKKLSKPSNIKFYLFKALKHTIFRQLKKNRKHTDFPEFDKLSFVTEYNIESKTIGEEIEGYQKELVSKILQELSPKQQEILYLRFTKGFNYIEISQLIDIDHNSVRKQVYRAIKKLRKNQVLLKAQRGSFMYFTLIV